jgi:transcriptional regulator with XRE-family HTH domain
MSETLGERIKRLRLARGITQKQLAELVGTEWHSAMYWESGSSIPSTPLVQPIARALNVTMEYLLSGREAPQLAALHAAIRRHDPYDRLVAMCPANPERHSISKHKIAPVSQDGLLKVCGSCGAEKPVTAFHANKAAPGGLRHSCKLCASSRYRARRIAEIPQSPRSLVNQHNWTHA